MQGMGLENYEEAGSSGCCWGRSVEELEAGAGGKLLFTVYPFGPCTCAAYSK